MWVISIVTASRITPGHLMIDLKRHVPSLGDMNPDEASTFGVTMARVK